jgi:hypothetical protein
VLVYLFLPEPKPAGPGDDGLEELADEGYDDDAEPDDGTRPAARRPVFAGGYPVPPMPAEQPGVLTPVGAHVRPGAAAPEREELSDDEEPPGV